MNRRLGGAVAAILVLGAALLVASSVGMVVDDAVPVPILDQWAQLVGSRTVTLSWLVSQHNEHRLLFPRLVFLADRWLSAETGRLSLATSLVVKAGLAAILLRLGRDGEPLGWRELAVRASVVVALLAWAVQYENDTWPFQVQFFGVLLAAAGCFATVASLRPAAWTTALAIGLGIVAAFTLSNGVVVLAMAAALAAWLRRPPAVVAALAVAAVAIPALYAIGYQTPPEHTNPVLAAMQPVSLLRYAAALLGGPFANALGMLTGQVEPWVAELVGAAGMGGLVALAASLRRPGAPPRRSALLALALFVVATAVLTASGRLGFGLPSALDSRYATPALVFWACLWLAGSAFLRRHPALAAVVAAGLLALVGWTQPRFIAVSAAVAANRAIAIPALVAGVADRTVLAPIYPVPDVPLRVRLTEFDSRTGPFSLVWAPWIGTKLPDHAALTDPARCRGRFDAAIRITDPSYPGWRVLGTLDQPAFKRRRHVVALTDGSLRIVGYGISDAGSTTLAVGGPAGQPPRTGWVGAVAGVAPDQVQAFVLLDHDHAACPLQNEPRVQSALQATRAGPAPEGAAEAGAVDAVYLKQQVTVDGWAMVQTSDGAPHIRVDTNLRVQSMTIASIARPDVAAAYHDPRLAESGFRVVMLLDPGPLPPRPMLCLWSEDALFGTRRLAMNPASGTARDLCPAGG